MLEIVTLRQVGCFFFNPSQPDIIYFVPSPQRTGSARESSRDAQCKRLKPTEPRPVRAVASFHVGIDRSVTATILLVRHAAHVELGRTLSGRRRDVALSEEGLEQAEIVGDLLGVEPITAVYSSPRERAYYTARRIAEPHEHKVEIVDALDEVDFGDWTGMAFSQLEGDPAWMEWNEARAAARPPNGESMAAAVERAAAALQALAAEHNGEEIVCVSHCDIIRGALAWCLGLPLDNLLRFDVDPASVSRIALGSWGARVMSVNERLYQ
jgi:broad specificity phosphatase PhoE